MDNRERERRSPASPGLRPASMTELRTLSDPDGAGSAGRPFRGQSPAPGSAGRGATGAAVKPLAEKAVTATPPLEEPRPRPYGSRHFLKSLVLSREPGQLSATGPHGEDEHAADTVGERCMIRHKRRLCRGLPHPIPDRARSPARTCARPDGHHRNPRAGRSQAGSHHRPS